MAKFSDTPVSIREMAANFADEDVSARMLLATLTDQGFLEDAFTITAKGLMSGILYKMNTGGTPERYPTFDRKFQERMASNIKWMHNHFPHLKASVLQPGSLAKNPAEKTKIAQPVNANCKFKYLNIDNFVVIDTETTGLDNDDEVVELAVLSSEGEKLYHSYFYPEKEVNPGAAKVNHLTKAVLKEKVGEKKLDAAEWAKILEVIGDKKILGHNIQFDIRLLSQTFKKNGVDEAADCLNKRQVIDSMDIAKRHIKNKSYSLNNLTTLIGITREEQHDAADDCLMTIEFLERLEDILRIKIEYSFIKI